MLSSFDPPYNSIEREKLAFGIYKYFVVNEDGERIKEIDDKYYNPISIGVYARLTEIELVSSKIEHEVNRINNEIDNLRKSIDIASEIESLEDFVKNKISPTFIPSEPELKSDLQRKLTYLKLQLEDIEHFEIEKRDVNASYYFHEFTYRKILPSYDVANLLEKGITVEHFKSISINEIDEYNDYDIYIDKVKSKEILLKAIIDDSGILLIDSVEKIVNFIPECCYFILELSRHGGSKWLDKYGSDNSEPFLPPQKLMAVINHKGDFIFTPKWISEEKTIKYQFINKSQEEFDIIFDIDSEFFNSTGNKIDISN